MQVAVHADAERRQFFGVICSIIAAGLFGVAVGMIMPLLPLRMESWGVEPFWIGLNAAASSVAIFIIAVRMQPLLAHFYLPNVLYVGVALFCVSLIGMAYWENLIAWFFFRFVLGIGVALLWIGEEIWISKASPEHLRGRLIALYAALFAGSAAVGPLVLQLTGLEGTMPFWAVVGLTLLSIVPIALAHNAAPSFEGEGRIAMRTVVKAAVFLLLAGAMAGVADGAAWSMLSLYGLLVGMDEGVAVLLPSVHLIGALVLQAPVGWIADRMDKSAVLAVMAGLSSLTALVMWLAGPGTPVFWLALFCAGGFMMGLYSVALSILGQRFKSGGLAAANAAFIMCFEIGIMTGGPATGAAMQTIGAPGLLLVMGGGCFLVVLAWPFRQRLGG